MCGRVINKVGVNQAVFIISQGCQESWVLYTEALRTTVECTPYNRHFSVKHV